MVSAWFKHFVQGVILHSKMCKDDKYISEHFFQLCIYILYMRIIYYLYSAHKQSEITYLLLLHHPGHQQQSVTRDRVHQFQTSLTFLAHAGCVYIFASMSADTITRYNTKPADKHVNNLNTGRQQKVHANLKQVKAFVNVVHNISPHRRMNEKDDFIVFWFVYQTTPIFK